jgi:hypothetical protein
MPILAGILSTLFGSVFTYLAARLSIGVAAAGAFMLTSGAAFLAVKLALAAVSSAVTAALPPVAGAAAGYFMPHNLGSCLTAILLADAISTSYDYWKDNLGTAFQLAKG